MQRGKNNGLPPIGQREATQPLNAYSPHEVFIEGAISRFEQRMDKMLTIMENGFENFHLAQNRTVKRLGKIYSRLDNLTNFVSGQTTQHRQHQPSYVTRQNSLAVEERESDNQATYDEREIANMNYIFAPKQQSQSQRDMPAIPAASVQRSNTNQGNFIEGRSEEQVMHQVSQLSHQNSVVEPDEEAVNQLNKLASLQEIVEVQHPVGSTAAEKALTKLGQFRDHIILLPLEDPIDGRRLTGKESPEELKAFLCKWIGRVADLITKETFHGYYNKEMNEQEMRVFLCNHMILAFHQMVAYLKKHYPAYWNPHKQQLIHMYQEQLTLALEYYLVKYPQKNKVFLNAELRDLIPEKNELAFPQFNMLTKLKICFNPISSVKILSEPEFNPREIDYTHTMKLFINQLIQQAKMWNEEFKKLMQRIFTIKLQDESVPLKDFQLSMKFKEDTAPFSDEQIRNPGVPIHSPEVLRILIKWIEELDIMLRQPEKNILEKGEETGGRSQIETLMLSRYNKELVSLIMEHYHKEFDENSTDRSIMDSAYNSLHDYVRHHRPQFNYLPETTVSCGMTVNLMSTLTCDIAVLYLGKLIGFFYAMNAECSKAVGQQGTNFLKLDQEMLPFSVCDLLRARCSCTVQQLAAVLKNIKTAPGVTIIRVKNRLETGNRDFLINFVFSKCRLVCEVQVGLKDTADEKGSCLHHFNHFLYELKRSKFGPMSESALIIANIIDVGAYFRQKTGARRNIKDILVFEPYIEGCKMKIQGYEMLKPNFTFLCNNCLESCSNRTLPPWKNLKQDEYLCGRCVYHKLDVQLRAIYALGEDVGPFYQQVDWKIENSKKSEYIAVLTSETLAKVDYYSTKEPPGLANQSKVFYGDIQKDIYYRCFSSLHQFHSVKHFKNHKIFSLKNELVEVALMLDSDVVNSSKTPWMIDLVSCMENLPESKQKFPYLDLGKETKFRVCFAFSNSEDIHPKHVEIARCCVDIDRRCVLLLDYERERANFSKSKETYIQEKLQSRSAGTQWKTEWNYDKKDFRDQLLLGLPDDDAVESVKMSHNAFTRLDILRAKSLKKLQLNFNKIAKPIVVENNYPALLALSLINNGIEELDFTVLKLPQLATLDVSANRINKIYTERKRSKEGTTPVTLPNLKNLNLRFNRLLQFDVLPTDFPEIDNIALSFNPITKMDITGFKNLKEFRASYTELVQFIMQGEYPKLEGLYTIITALQQCDLSQAITPKLIMLYFSYNRLKTFKFPRNANDLSVVNLQCNYLTELNIGSPTETYPKLKELLLYFNCLAKLNITMLGSCSYMQNLNISFNENMTLIAAPEAEITKGYLKRQMPYPTDDSFKKWIFQQLNGPSVESFKKHLLKDYPSFPMRVWNTLAFVNDSVYMKAMETSTPENAQSSAALNQLWGSFATFFKTYVKTDPNVNPFYAKQYEREMMDYKFLKPKKDDPDGELEEIIPSFTIPLGEICSDCGKTLTIPYYYGIGSKKHRCRECCEKEKEGYTNQLERYLVNQNSILIMGDRVVDAVRLGANTQPTTQKQCSPHSIQCNGCLSNKVGSKPRYQCLNCRREPSNMRDGYVDFCYGCTVKLCGTQAERDSVMKICTKDGHKPSHSMLRILYKVVNYYKY